MSSNVVPFPSCGTARDHSQRGAYRTPPARHVIKVVGFDFAVSEAKEALHQIRPRDDGVLRALNPTDVRLVGAEFGRNPTLGFSFLFAPINQLHGYPPSLARGVSDANYAAPSYLVNGHGDLPGAEYAPVAYIYQMHPGNRIRQLRKAAGLTQEQLADRTGFAQDRISNYENGRRPLRLAEMRVIARELGCSPADLLADDDNPERLSPQEKALLEAFRSSSRDAQHFLLASAQAVSDQEDPQRTAA